MSEKLPSHTKPSPAKLRMVSNERGAVLALVALLLVVFLGLAALAIDLGLLYVARGEAQRAADAAAHAGAGYLMANPNATEAEIKAEAVRVGQRNLVRGGLADIDPDRDVEILWDENKVRVWAHRTSERDNPVRTLFASVIGFGQVGVSAMAAAEVWTATHAKCLLPVALPDRWCEEWDAATGTCGRWPDQMDSFDPENDPGDHYIPWTEDADAWTGYGQQSLGDTVYLRPEGEEGGQGQGQGSGGERWMPGWWAPFYSDDPPFGGQDVPKNNEAIRGCDEAVLGVGSEVRSNTGNPATPTREAWDDLIAQDPNAVWDTQRQCVTSGDGICRDSPRARPIALFDPRTGPGNAGQPFELSNLAAVFIDEVLPGKGSNLQVRAIFVNNVGNLAGEGGGANDLLNKLLRIVE